MSFKEYLGAFLLGAAAYLYSPVLQAEDIQQKVTFTGSSKNDMIEDLEGTVTATAYQEGQTLYLTLIADKCKIRKGYSRIEIGLPAESDIIEMKQTAEVDVRTEDGRSYERKLIELHPENELINKGITKAAESVAGKIKIPIIQELWLDNVEKTKSERIGAWYKQMKHQGLFMEDISFYSAKRSDKCDDNLAFARNYKFTLNLPPDITAKAIMQIAVQDDHDRNIVINEISVKFDERKVKQQVQVNVPKGLEKFLINDKDFVPTKFFGPEEINKILGTSVKDSYLIEYQSSPESREDFTIYAYILGEESKKLKKVSEGNEAIKKVGKLMGETPAECILNSKLFAVGYKEEKYERSTNFPPADMVISKGMVLAIYVGFPSNNLINKHLEKKEGGNKNLKQIYDKNLFESTYALSEKLSKVLDPLFREGGFLILPVFFVD
jgi:hypothetical protein